MKIRPVFVIPLMILAVSLSCHSGQPQQHGLEARVRYISARTFHALADDFYRFHPAKAFDNDPESAWAASEAGDDRNNFIIIEFTEPVTADAVRILPGYFRKNEFTRYNRLKTVRLESEAFQMEAVFSDSMTGQIINFDAPCGFDALTLNIEDIFPGEQDITCISEIQFLLDGREISIALDEESVIVKNLPPGPNLPAGKKIVLFGMAGNTVQYFFPDGVYAEDVEWYRQDLLFETELGTWEYDPVTEKIQVHRTVRLMLQRRGDGVWVEEIGYCYEDYVLEEREIDERFTVDWSYFSSNWYPWESPKFILEADRQVRQRELSPDFQAAIDYRKELFRENK